MAEEKIDDKPIKEVLEQEQKVIDFFKDPDLMNNISRKLDERHIGNTKEKMLTFVTECSSRLKPEYRNSNAVTGDTSEGKTNLIKSTLKHIPDEWYAFGTRFTKATLEDDVKDFNLIILLEKPKDDSVAEAIKQMAEDGQKIWKKDVDSGKLKEAGYIPRKSIIWSSTSEESNEELANRFLITSIDRDTERYQQVLNREKRLCYDLDAKMKLEEPSIIKRGLKRLKQFNFIEILYADLLFTEPQDARIQRDFKRLLNLIRTIAWINQENRIKFEHKGKTILLATPEDFHWAMYLSEEAFFESISGLSKRIQETYDAIKVLTEKSGKYTFEVSDIKTGMVEEQRKWIQRTDLQRNLKIKDQTTIKARIDELVRRNAVETYQQTKHSKQFVSLLPQLGNQLLMRYDSDMMFFYVKHYWQQIVHNYFITFSYPIHNKIHTLPITNLYHRDKENNNTDMNNFEIIPSDIDFFTLMNVLSRKFITKIHNIQKSNEGDKKKQNPNEMEDEFSLEGDDFG